MTRTITLRLSDDAYAAVRRHADADQQSMNSWVEAVLDAEDMRRRCAAHSRWMDTNPRVGTAALTFWEANQQDMSAAGLPTLTSDTQ